MPICGASTFQTCTIEAVVALKTSRYINKVMAGHAYAIGVASIDAVWMPEIVTLRVVCKASTSHYHHIKLLADAAGPAYPGKKTADLPTVDTEWVVAPEGSGIDWAIITAVHTFDAWKERIELILNAHVDEILEYGIIRDTMES